MNKQKIIYLAGLFTIILLCLISCNNDDGNTCSPSTSLDCGAKTEPESDCEFSEFTLITSADPNPVQSGGTTKISAIVRAINLSNQPIPVNIDIEIYSITRQLVKSSTYVPQQVSTAQDIPVWQNINAAAGNYTAEITVNKGVCGLEKICINITVL
ncbi:hypothetical protein IMCC3317_00090 [Kordia antarctica]|uniref:Uncharacterized protein n=1 Tax=Kordia antarctica TaxID=1218801 RepID=A0A7L4ZEK9_9FLAO|nr:hypothetical protein [Kordia antarctica]QHI34666.1 hypothetical protein IMCC3317_00090 [Kordia antarctica]